MCMLTSHDLQAVKNLVFCAKVLHRFSTHTDHTPSVREEGTPAKDLSWLIGQLSKLARFEAGHHPKQSRKVCVSFSSSAWFSFTPLSIKSKYFCCTV